MTIDLERYIAIFAALSEATRLQMIQLIDEADEMPCTALIERLGVAKSTVSYHIKILAHAKLISIRKQGRNYFYTPRRDVLDEAMPGLRERLATQGTTDQQKTGVTSDAPQKPAAAA